MLFSNIQLKTNVKQLISSRNNVLTTEFLNWNVLKSTNAVLVNILN